MTPSLPHQLLSIRRTSTPLVALTTPDPAATLREQIVRLQQEAHNRYLSASQPGLYQQPDPTPVATSGRQRFQE